MIPAASGLLAEHVCLPTGAVTHPYSTASENDWLQSTLKTLSLVPQVFDDMMAAGGVQPTVITWNLLLASFGATGDWMAALDVLAKANFAKLQHLAPHYASALFGSKTHVHQRTYVCSICWTGHVTVIDEGGLPHNIACPDDADDDSAEFGQLQLGPQCNGNSCAELYGPPASVICSGRLQVHVWPRGSRFATPALKLAHFRWHSRPQETCCRVDRSCPAQGDAGCTRCCARHHRLPAPDRCPWACW